MSIYKDTIRFKQVPMLPTPTNFQVGMAISAWLTYTASSYTRNPKTGEYIAPVVSLPPEYRLGKTYHKWIKMGFLVHTGGFEYGNHYVKLPIAWLDEVYETIITEAYTGEDGNEVPESSVDVTNRGHYFQALRTNDSHCLVKITDARYAELKELIEYDAEFTTLNIIAEDKFLTAITEGGEFYVAPEVGEEDD